MFVSNNINIYRVVDKKINHKKIRFKNHILGLVIYGCMRRNLFIISLFSQGSICPPPPANTIRVEISHIGPNTFV